MLAPAFTRRLALAVLLLAPFSFASRPWTEEGTQATFNPDGTISIDPEEGFTMVIATHKRNALLPPLIEHLTTTPPPSLREIVFVWQNVGEPLPDFLNSTALDQYSTSGVAVSVRLSKKNSMNERFRPLVDWNQPIQTRAVMIMDDDVALRRETLEWGYQEWRKANDDGKGPVESGRIVGFAGRDFNKEVNGEFSYTVQPRTTYSMVLSNAAWLKRDWLEKYWLETEEMQELRDYVDKVFNCDDLLINYLVSNLTHTPPLLLQPKTPLRTVPTKGLWNRDDESDTSFMGSSAPPSSDTLPTSEEAAPADPNDPMKSDHFGTRRVCINHYFAHFARYAPSTPSAPASSSSHYPLIRTSTSVSQDVVDRARWLSPGEEWEEPVWHAMDEEGVEERERREREEFEEMIEGMDDEQVRELMEQLEGMQEGDEDDDEEAFEEDEDEEEEGLAHDEL